MNYNTGTNFQFSFSNLSDVLYNALRKYSKRLIDSTTLFYVAFNILEEDNFDKDMFVKLQKYHRSLELVMSYYGKEPIFNISSENLQRDKNSKYYSWNDLFFSKKAFKVLTLSQYLAFLDKRTEITAKDVWKALIITQCGGWMDYLTLNENDFNITRIHECGHALISYFNKYSTILFACSIPTENRNGYVLTEYNFADSIPRAHLFNYIMRFMAGIAALIVCSVDLKDYYGATNDIKMAYELARILATEYDGLINEIDIQEKIKYYIDKTLAADIIILRTYIELLYLGVEILKWNNDVCNGEYLTDILKKFFEDLYSNDIKN